MPNDVTYIQTLYDTGCEITPEMDGGVYGVSISDCVCKGIGSNLAAEYTLNTGTDIKVKTGQAVIGGSFFRVKSKRTISLTNYADGSAKSLNIYAKIDKSASPCGGFSVKTTSQTPESGNLAGSGTVREMLLYTISIDGTGHITSFSDKRTLKENGQSSFAGLNFVYCASMSAYNAISPKDSNTYYFIKEAS